MFLSISQVVSDYNFKGAYSSALAGTMVSQPGNAWSVIYNPASIGEINPPNT